MRMRSYSSVCTVLSVFFLGTHIVFAAVQDERPLKQRRTETVAAIASPAPQVYGIATYDALFKYILSDDKIRPSFLHAFAPDLPVVSSERLDDHMNPIQQLQLLRNFLHSEKTADTVKQLSSAHKVQVLSSVEKAKKAPVINDEATAFLHELVGRFDEIRSSFPEPRYNGTMDFVCRLKGGDYAMVEMQVIPQDYWDRRALAYVAAFYGNQLTRGGHFKDIRKVIGINILGGGKGDLAHWVDTPGQFARHYKFQEQLQKPPLYIDGIELIQYSIMNAPKSVGDQAQQDWITFFKEGHYMTERDVKIRIKTPDVLRAFARAKLHALPADVREAYVAEDKEYDRYSQHTQTVVTTEVTAEKKNIAQKMLEKKMPDETIVECTGLTVAEIKMLRRASQYSAQADTGVAAARGFARKRARA